MPPMTDEDFCKETAKETRDTQEYSHRCIRSIGHKGKHRCFCWYKWKAEK